MSYTIGYVDIATDIDTGDIANGKIATAFTNAQSAVNSIDGRLLTVEALATKFNQLVLNATSDAAEQAPAGIDVPMQVKFGPAQNDESDAVMSSVDGVITFNTSGSYVIKVTVIYKGSTVDEVVNIFSRFTHNTAQASEVYGQQLVQDAVVKHCKEVKLTVLSGDIVTFEIARDSSGANAGVLHNRLNSLGWGVEPSAHIEVIASV